MTHEEALDILHYGQRLVEVELTRLRKIIRDLRGPLCPFTTLEQGIRYWHAETDALCGSFTVPNFVEAAATFVDELAEQWNEADRFQVAEMRDDRTYGAELVASELRDLRKELV